MHARRDAKIRIADASHRGKQVSVAKTKETRSRNSHPNRQSITKGESTAPVVAAIRELVRRAEGSGLERIQDQRREIVSVRLSEDESERLRQRAAESGISVSAYMRSCVLEADHLRAQVKAALAEMRSMTRAGAGPAESHELTAFHADGDTRGRHGISWPGFLSKAAALLLGSWLHFGRRA